MAEWSDNPAQYVADEEESTFTVRVSGELLIDALLQVRGGAGGSPRFARYAWTARQHAAGSDVLVSCVLEVDTCTPDCATPTHMAK